MTRISSAIINIRKVTKRLLFSYALGTYLLLIDFWLALVLLIVIASESYSENPIVEDVLSALPITLPIALPIAIPFSINVAAKFIRKRNEKNMTVQLLADYVHSELIRNKNILEFVNKQLKEGYVPEGIDSALLGRNEIENQGIRMGQFVRAAEELNAYLSDQMFIAMVNNGAILKLNNDALSKIIWHSYEVLFHVKHTARQQSGFLQMLLDRAGNDQAIFNTKMWTELALTAMNRVLEEVGLAIWRIEKVQKEFTNALKRMDMRIEIVHRDDAIGEWRSAVEQTSKKTS